MTEIGSELELNSGTTYNDILPDNEGRIIKKDLRIKKEVIEW